MPIKGGGGGSLGVVTRVTLRTHSLPELRCHTAAAHFVLRLETPAPSKVKGPS
jgi:FAD/FMN-containing dehydrogenase